MERVLTREKIETAERGKVRHPIVDVMVRHAGLIGQLGRDVSRIEDGLDQQHFIAKTHGFLADAIADLEDYSLEPLEMVTIWSKVLSLFDNIYQRYRVAGMIALDYARRGTPKAGKNLPRYFIENEDYPDNVYQDKEIVNIFLNRFKEISESIHVLVAWRRLNGGERESLSGRQRYLISQMAENFSNALFPLSGFLRTPSVKFTS